MAHGRAGDTAGSRTSPYGASSKGLNRVLSPHPGPEAELLKLGLVLAEELLTLPH